MTERQRSNQRAYNHLQDLIQGGLCEIKQGREDGGMVLSLEYSTTCGESCQREVFTALFQAAGEYLRLQNEKKASTASKLQAKRKKFGSVATEPDEFDKALSKVGGQPEVKEVTKVTKVKEKLYRFDAKKAEQWGKWDTWVSKSQPKD